MSNLTVRTVFLSVSFSSVGKRLFSVTPRRCRHNNTRSIIYSEFRNLYFLPKIIRGWDISVEQDVQEILFRSPARPKIFIFCKVSKLVLGPIQPPVSWLPGSLSREKLLRRGVTTHTHPVWKLWINGAKLQLPHVTYDVHRLNFTLLHQILQSRSS
jgi:hypothetical protein